jgi:hypothetical protein
MNFTCRGELVPLLAGDLAGLAADADGRVRVEAGGRAGRRGHAAAASPYHALRRLTMNLRKLAR